MSSRVAAVAIMLDERPLVDRWVDGLRAGVFSEVLVVDGGSRDGTVERLAELGVLTIVRAFPGDFSAQRNLAIDHTSAEWILEVDADECPSSPLLRDLHLIIADAEAVGVDCFGIPRLTFHDDALQHGPGLDGLDYQYRLHRRHVRWKGAVHEEVDGFLRRAELPLREGYFLWHSKTAARHAERNELYRRMAG